MFSKFKYIGFSFLLLAGVSICSQDLLAMDVEHDVGGGPSRTQLARFINGQKKVHGYERANWVSHSFRWLEHLYDQADNMKDRAKAALGFAHLSSQFRNFAFPSMDYLASTRYSLELLQGVINTDSSLDEDVDFKRYRNHARVFWGELAVYNLNGYASDDELSAAWGYLSEIEGRYTKIGKVFQAELLLNRGFRPTGVEEDAILHLASQLLSDSYSSSRTASLISQISDRSKDSSSDEVQGEVNVKPQNLHSRNAQALRAKLEIQLVRERAVAQKRGREQEDFPMLEDSVETPDSFSDAVAMELDNDVQKINQDSRREEEPVSKKQRAQKEDSEGPSVRLADQANSLDSDSESSSELSEQPGRKRKNPEVHSWMAWTVEQNEAFETLWKNGVKGKALYESVWDLMSAEQKTQFSGAQDKKFIDSIHNTRRYLMLDKRVNRNEVSGEEFAEFLRLLGLHKTRKEIMQIMNISPNRYKVLSNKARRD